MLKECLLVLLMCFLLDLVLSSGEELSLTQSKAAHAEPSLLSAHKKRHFCIRSLLHKLWEGKVSWEPAAWGPQLHAQDSCFFSPASPYPVTQQWLTKPIRPSLRKNSLASDLTDLAFSAERVSLACGHSFLVL